MRWLRILALLLAAGWMSFALTPARADDGDAVDPARLAAAKELMVATGVDKAMDGMVAAMANGFKKGAAMGGDQAQADKASADFDKFIGKFKVYMPQMIDDTAKTYARHFTVEEMKAATAFYQSDVGKKFVNELPVLMQENQGVGIKYAQKVIEEMKSGN